MNGNSHRIAYEALKAKLDVAEAEGDAAALDRATAALDVFMANITPDPRRLRAIALMSSTRTPAAPEIPTIRESGIAALKDFYLDNYYGFMAPPGTPPAVAAKIGADIRRLAETPDVRKKLEGAGLDMLLLGPTEMMKLIRDDATKYAAAARAADIKPE